MIFKTFYQAIKTKFIQWQLCRATKRANNLLRQQHKGNQGTFYSFLVSLRTLDAYDKLIYAVECANKHMQSLCNINDEEEYKWLFIIIRANQCGEKLEILINQTI